MALEALRGFIARGLPSDAEFSSNIIGAKRVDDKRFFLPRGSTNFQGYEVKNLSPFSSPEAIQSFLQSLGEKAASLGFDILGVTEEKGPSDNDHYGLSPTTHYDYSGTLDLRRRVRYPGQLANDRLTILVGNTGEIDSSYDRFDRLPITGFGRRRCMDEVALARILPLPIAA